MNENNIKNKKLYAKIKATNKLNKIKKRNKNERK